MRVIKRIFVHCTASWQTQTIDQLKHEFYDKPPKGKGWQAPGYHFVVSPDGTVTQLLSVEQVSNGVQGYNSTAINVAYIGGITKNAQGKVVPVDNRTPQQQRALVTLLHQLKKKYPTAEIMGHRSIWGESTPQKWLKTCPNFNAQKEYKDI